MSDLEHVFGVAMQLLDWTSARARALNTNLAHASQPGYRRVDVDFAPFAKAAHEKDPDLRARLLAKTHPKIEVDRDAPESTNGNTVRFETEQIEVEKNALLHELATFVVNGKLQTLRAAISGRA